MQKIAIWGSGKAGRYVWEKYKNRVVCIIDNHPGTDITEVQVVDQTVFIRDFSDSIDVLIVTARLTKSCYEILSVIDDTGIQNVAILKPSVFFFRQDIRLDDFSEDALIWYRKTGVSYPVVPRLEINLIDGCNLNCKACTHFSSLFSADSAYPLDDYIHTLEKLRKAGRFVRLRLLGGEPLLINNLDEYLYVTRNLFDEADIEIVTNGLLLDRLSERIINAILQTNTYISISLYPPTEKKIRNIKTILNEYGINHICDEKNPISSFVRNITKEGTHDGTKSSSVCLSAGCLFLRNNKIYKCPPDGMIKAFSDHYGISVFPESAAIDIDTEERLVDKMRDISVNPVPMCRFCSEELEEIPWEVRSNPELNEWFYKG